MKPSLLRTAVPAAAILALQLTAAASAQQLDLPRPSPKASVSQTVGAVYAAVWLGMLAATRISSLAGMTAAVAAALRRSARDLSASHRVAA